MTTAPIEPTSDPDLAPDAPNPIAPGEDPGVSEPPEPQPTES